MTRVQFFLSVLILSFLTGLNAKAQSLNGKTIECISMRNFHQLQDGTSYIFQKLSTDEIYGEGRKYNRFQFLLGDNLIVQQNWLRDEVFEIQHTFYDGYGDLLGWLVTKRSDPDYPYIIKLGDGNGDNKYLKILNGGSFTTVVWKY